MKIKDGYILDTIGDQKIAISLDQSNDKFSGMIKLNSVGAFLWEKLADGIEEEALVKAVTDQYEIDAQTAQKDVKAFLEKLDQNGILER